MDRPLASAPFQPVLLTVSTWPDVVTSPDHGSLGEGTARGQRIVVLHRLIAVPAVTSTDAW